MYFNKHHFLDTCESATVCPDYIETGAGPLVVLVHASMAGARQWSTLMPVLDLRAKVRAVNLFGYEQTPAWPGAKPPSLDDYASLVAAIVPRDAEKVSLVGHSFGGAVAMQAAAQHLRGRVDRLVLIEPSPFYLLDNYGRNEASYEILTLADQTSRLLGHGDVDAAAEIFIDYWCGKGTWAATSPGRRDAMRRMIFHLSDEWGAILNGGPGLGHWGAKLPSETLLMTFAETVRPSRELVEVLSDACPAWEVASIREGGHMAPLTHPHIVNPIIRDFLSLG